MTIMLENLETLELGRVQSRIHELKDSGYRFVTITCCSNPDGTNDLFYSFDYEDKLVNLKTTIEPQTPVPSVSSIYLAAAFVENEIAELFGVHFTGLVLDYGGKFILSEGAPDSPFGKGVILVNKDKESTGDKKESGTNE